MIANLLSQIADQQIQQNKILTGFYLDENQLAEIRSHLEAHAPHPDVGGLGRFQSVPVFRLMKLLLLLANSQARTAFNLHTFKWISSIDYSVFEST